jgi:sugar transferase (PEP-CTERM system associated)
MFRHHVPRISLVLATGEATLFFGLMVFFVFLTFHNRIAVPSDAPFALSHAAGFSAWVVAVTILMMGATGLYNREVMFEIDEVLARMALSFSMAFAVILCIELASASLDVSFATQYKSTAIAIALCAIGSVLVRSIFARVANREDLKRRMIVIGCGRRAAKIYEMERTDRYRFKIVGFVDCGAVRNGVALEPFFPHSSIATPEAALSLVKYHRADGIIVASEERRGIPHSALLRCRMEGIDVKDFSAFWESHAGNVDIDSLQPSWFTYSDGFSMNRDRLLAKSCFDYLVASLLLLVTSPIIVLTALTIKCTSSGPVFFRQERVGRNGRIFNVLKFRSMSVDAERAGPQWAKVNDSRVTAVGRFIRKVRIDELPQVINILKGEMSFVGPRPERPHFVSQLNEAIPYFDERHRVKPGLSGWAQINYPYGASTEDARNKLSYDLYYLKNGTIFLDFLILLRTVHVILWPYGAR